MGPEFGFANNLFTANNMNDALTLGATWYRNDLRWAAIEATRGTYNWASTDAVVSLARTNGMKFLPLLTHTPSWAVDANGILQPQYYQDYANFCVAAVTRYAPQGIKHYEIWNEPNNATVSTNGVPLFTAQTYTSLLQLAYPAMKVVDPTITILAGPSGDGGTSGVSQTTFLQDMITNGASSVFDVLALHPYNTLWNNVAPMHQALVNSGHSGRVWLTENGAPTGGVAGQWFTTEQDQVAYLNVYIINARSLPYIEKVFFYTYSDINSLQPDREGYFGIIRSDGSYKPAHDALRIAILQL